MEVTSQLGPEYCTRPTLESNVPLLSFNALDRSRDKRHSTIRKYQLVLFPGFSIHSRSARRVTRFISQRFENNNGTYVRPNWEVDFTLFRRVIVLCQYRGYVMAQFRGMMPAIAFPSTPVDLHVQTPVFCCKAKT